MLTTLRHLMTCCALLALALAQVFGVKAGYFCVCTGQVSELAQCETTVCHPLETDACDHEEESEHHEHQELRDGFVAAGAVPAAVLPLVGCFDLPVTFYGLDLSSLGLGVEPKEVLEDPPRWGCLPEPPHVARTAVMLV